MRTWVQTRQQQPRAGGIDLPGPALKARRRHPGAQTDTSTKVVLPSYRETNTPKPAGTPPDPSTPVSALAPLAQIAKIAAAQIARIRLLIRASSYTNAHKCVRFGALRRHLALRFPTEGMPPTFSESTASFSKTSVRPQMQHILIVCSRTSKWSMQCC